MPAIRKRQDNNNLKISEYHNEKHNHIEWLSTEQYPDNNSNEVNIWVNGLSTDNNSTLNRVKKIHNAFYLNLIEPKDLYVPKLNRQAPSELKTIIDAIEKSSYLLSLDNNWDDEDGEPIDSETWQNSANFLLDYAIWVFDKSGICIQTPKISPGPENSIDILWKSLNFRLLVNISQKEGATYYGDDTKNNNSIKGSLIYTDIQIFFGLWLMEMNS